MTPTSIACCREPAIRGGRCVNCDQWLENEVEKTPVAPKKDKRKKLAKAEVKAEFWVSIAKEGRGGEPSKRTRVSARKAKKGLSRARRLLDRQVIEEEKEPTK